MDFDGKPMIFIRLFKGNPEFSYRFGGVPRFDGCNHPHVLVPRYTLVGRF